MKRRPVPPAATICARLTERLALLAHALLAGAEGAEVLDGARSGLAEQAHGDATGRLAIDLDIEEHLKQKPAQAIVVLSASTAIFQRRAQAAAAVGRVERTLLVIFTYGTSTPSREQASRG